MSVTLINISFLRGCGNLEDFQVCSDRLFREISALIRRMPETAEETRSINGSRSMSERFICPPHGLAVRFLTPPTDLPNPLHR